MNNITTTAIPLPKLALCALCLFILHSTFFIPARAQGTTAFTYQGRLNTGANPANGSYDMAFTVYDANVNGHPIAGPITNSAVAVSNGLFTVTLNFGAGVFTGTNYWVQMAVGPAGAGLFAPLVPLQPLTPAPYALSLVAQTPQANALCPPGSVMAYMGATAPPGWLLCDGSVLSQTQYPALFAVLGIASGAGTNATTFNLPDMRGLFLRGVNGGRSDGLADPDDNTTFRTNIFTGGNTGNTVGSYQADQYAAHNHVQGNSINTGIASDIYGDALFGAPVYAVNYIYSTLTLSPNHPFTSTQGGNETRPKNVYVNYIIKY